MKTIINYLALALMFSFMLHADEMSDAYLKEYTFLKAQKSELTKRLQKEEKLQNEELAKASADVNRLQTQYISETQKIDTVQTQTKKSSETLEKATSNKDIIASVAVQAKSGLNEYGVTLPENSKDDLVLIENAFNEATKMYKKLSSVQKTNGEFFLADGTTAKGEIIKIGNVAAYGVSDQGSGALAPAGGGTFKLWNKPGSDIDAKAFAQETPGKTLNIFVYETLDKEVEFQHEKTIDDILKAGGPIGYAIIALGILGLFLVLLRAIFLYRAGSNDKKITTIVYQTLEKGTPTQALDAISDYKGSAARVIKATLRNVGKEREHVEDIVMESILSESGPLDRFGSFILVIASVGPLLGLLGTVTGMIATFDSITQYGTSDPKLLSGGISEALVTTELGLVVAIPLLLFGNLLSGWASKIKDAMEHGALHVINLYEKHRAK
jgi:biopolymer transport protein ExbB